MTKGKARNLAFRAFLVALTALLLVGGFRYRALANDDDNPYTQLYKLRVSQAESNVKRAEALEQLASGKLARGERLLSSAAISREEYETLVSDRAVTNADSGLARQKVDEAKAYLKIIEALVARGVSIPLCTYETE